ncbi:response regulator [Flavobacterium aquicola]|uniref:LuxR family two component transcriptional regulator n=1 Tax=Flavobacterium aquicola TaxID=1682742 RepID=A0A3E0ETY2_9FLAO|nr:response regulator transcription factor [Flavobacterium aquicola]REH01672.1 LuxR family two component transcriptional regulator [Flavobacterium aquicola]
MTELNYNIVIADDHKLIISGINHIIATNNLGKIISEVYNGVQLLQFLQNNTVDLVIIDINMPELNGIDAAKKIIELYPAVSILMLSQYENIELIRKLKNIGAKGYLSKNFEITELIEAIKTIKENDVFFPSLDAAGDIVKKDKFHLSAREVEIISLIAQGKTSKEIGNELILSEYTIETHRKNCMRKLEVNSIVTLLNKAKELGYIF